MVTFPSHTLHSRLICALTAMTSNARNLASMAMMHVANCLRGARRHRHTDRFGSEMKGDKFESIDGIHGISRHTEVEHCMCQGWRHRESQMNDVWMQTIDIDTSISIDHTFRSNNRQRHIGGWSPIPMNWDSWMNEWVELAYMLFSYFRIESFCGGRI